MSGRITRHWRDGVEASLRASGLECPLQYLSLRAATPADRCIAGLDPWIFVLDAATLGNLMDLCSGPAGTDALPFAQALDEGMVACFVNRGGPEPGIVVVDPWAAGFGSPMIAELSGFGAWHAFAASVAAEVHARDSDQEDP